MYESAAGQQGDADAGAAPDEAEAKPFRLMTRRLTLSLKSKTTDLNRIMVGEFVQNSPTDS